MVSPAPLASANPPLSYAERARKAQNVKPRESQRPAAPSTSTTTAAASSSSISHSATVSSPTAPTAPKPLLSSPAAAKPRISSETTMHLPSSSKSTTTTTISLNTTRESKPNGDINHRIGDSASSVSVPPVPNQATAPPVNVWNVRKEQMAQRALTQSRSAQPVALSTSQSSASTLSSTPPPGSGTSTTAPSPSPSTSANTSNKPAVSTTSPSTNGQLAAPTDDDDPFVVKPGRSVSSLNPSVNVSPSSVHPSLHPSPPAIDDTESWPEVGQVTGTNSFNGRAENKEGRDDEEKVHERETSQGRGSRKSEKTKWVPIPPENLQFEGPARAQHAKQRSHHDRNNNHRQSGTPPGVPSTSSGQGSQPQQQSRTHSVTGRRATPSHASSVSHSQAQSRTGSVHSSPRHSSVRGGGRRLPDETTIPVFGVNRSLLSSGTNSPSTYAQPQPLPAQEFIPGVRPYINPSTAPGGRDLSTLSANPDSATELNPQSTHYPQHAPPFGISPYHSPRSSGSPASNIYSLPPVGYPGQPAMQAIPVSGYGTPPYPLYPSYGFYGQPFMYWHPPGVSAQQMTSSPMTNPQPNDGVPPPTMVARPPPPNQSDAVAGYRDVGFVLPPPVEYRREQVEERGRRARELSFGSIGAGLEGTSKSPSPATSPSLIPVSDGAALGLDVSGGQSPASVVTEAAQGQDEKPEESKEEGKVFTIFSIGVAPGESAPRVRSRTQTQSKAQTLASGQVASSAKEDEDVGASAEVPVGILADMAAKVFDLTETETKWQFGTTKVVEGTDEDDQAVPSSTNAPRSNDAPVSIPVPNFVPPTPLSLYAGVPPFVPQITLPTGAVNGMPNAPSPSTYGPRQPLSASEEEWEVRDYGYGFKRDGPMPIYPQATVPPREERPFRGGRDYQQGEREPHYSRPRRGSYSQGGYGYDRGGERGSYAGRRGRGLSGGYGGRGYQNRSYSGRGGYSGQNPQRQQTYVPQPHTQSQPQAEINGFYAPPVPSLATYIPQPYEGYPFTSYPPPMPQPHTSSTQGAPLPLPVPQSNVGFPLDTTRYYLLGQLEYYLSAQNLAQDLYLRQQMDSSGWIPISCIASFNRVRALTLDTQLVTDVLSLSSLVEVNGEYVRMRQWQMFVLPTAELSRVEDDGSQPQQPPVLGEQYQMTQEHQAENHVTSQNHDGEDEEEEDVVFVL